MPQSWPEEIMSGSKKYSRVPRGDKAMVDAALSDEVSERTWEIFEAAMLKLEPHSLELLKEYFSGASVGQLAKAHKLTQKEMATWIERNKRQLILEMKAAFEVKQ